MNKDKVFIRPILNRNPFLKSPDEVCQLFGFPMSARSRVKLVAHMLEQEVGLSDRSLDNLGKKGISRRLAETSLYPIFQSMQDYLDLDDSDFISEDIKTFDMHPLWSETIKVFFASARLSEEQELCFQPLRAFIERRCDEYRPQKEWFEHNCGMNKEDAISYLSEFYRPVLDKTMLNSVQQDRIIKVFDRTAPGVELEIDDSEVEAFAYLTHDFNLSFFAALELSLRNIARWHGAIEKNNKSFLTQMMAIDGKCYFDRFIGLIKKKSDLTYKDLAKFIPIDFNENASGRTRGDAQLERLKEWRKGKVRPSWKVLDEYFSYFDPSDQLPLMLFGFICQAIDRIMESKELSDKDRVVMQRVYSEENYSRYYEKEKAAALTAAEGATSV